MRVLAGFSVAVIDEDGTQQLHVTEVKAEGLASAKGAYISFYEQPGLLFTLPGHCGNWLYIEGNKKLNIYDIYFLLYLGSSDTRVTPIIDSWEKGHIPPVKIP